MPASIPYRNPNPYRSQRHTYWGYAPSADDPSEARLEVNEHIAWTLDGVSIPFSGWSATMTAPGGYERCTGQTAAAKVPYAEQGSVLVGWREGGGELWRGKLAAPPRVQDGIAYLSANGPRDLLDAAGGPLLFQMRNASLFVAADADPHDYNISERYVIDAKNSRLQWKQRSVVYGAGNKAGFVMWATENPITRIAFTMKKSDDDGDFDIDIYNADGPDGTPSSAIASYSLGAGNPDGTKKDLDITNATTAKDLIYVAVIADGSTVTDPKTFWLQNFRINALADARHTDSSGSPSWDIFYSSDVAAVVAERLGMGTSRIRTSAMNVLPLFWDEGTHAELLDYMADLDDWRWLATGDGIEYGPWDGSTDGADGIGGRRWDVSFGFHANAELEPMKLYNRVTVRYETTSGTTQSVSVDADPNPFNQTGEIVEFIADLSDAQDSDVSTSASGPEKQYKTLASAYAEHLGSYYFTRRVRGDVNLASVGGAGGPQSPYAVRAGDIVTLTDHSPTVPAQRIVTATYTPSGCRITLSEEINPIRLAAGRGKRHHRRRKRRR